MKSSIQFVTTPTADTPGTSLWLSFENKRYLIGNMSEGTQRAMNQTGTKLMKISDILMTGRTEWSNIGGLVGMILTLADQNAASMQSAKERVERNNANGKKDEMPEMPILNLYGAPNLNHMLGTCRRFVFRKGMPIRATEFKDDAVKRDIEGNIEPWWSDEFISVWALPIRPTDSSGSDHSTEQELRRQLFEQMNSKNEEFIAPDGETPEDREIRYDRMRRSIVRHMFESNWSFDALVEKHISEVEMPATIFVRDRETHKIDKYTGPMPGSDEPLPDIKVMIRTPWPAALLESLPPTKPCPEAISYIFRPHPQRGKFNAKKMQGLNVSDKTKWALLAKGENVVNDDGETITPDQVLGPSRPVAGLAVIDLPSIEYVDALVKREEWASEKLRSDIKAVVWILGPGVAASPKLRQFIADMNHCKHVVSSVDHCCNRLAMVGAAASTLRMAQVDPDRYGVLHHDNATLPQEAFNLPSVPQPRLPEGVVAAEVGLAFDFAPTFQLRTDQVKKPHNPLKVLESTQAVILDLAKNAREEIEASRESLDAWKSGMPRPGTDITTLGTGSALPSKYRNVSATLVRVPGVGNYLLDCGENTLGQLKRVFKPTELKEVLKDLRMIWISHLHADHHLGTASLIKAWYSVVHDSVPTTEAINLNPTADDIPQRRLAVVSHMGMSSWLNEYASVEDFGFSRILPLCISENNQVFYSSNSTPSELELFAPPGQRPDDGSGKVPKAAYEALLGLSDIQAVFVAHCSGAMAVVMTLPPDPSARNMQPLKISYSGDCRPSARFASIGAGTSVLIHEATFDDELHYDAVAKKHSTTSEALQVGEWMGARGVVLTHFSQRYQKIPVLRQAEPDDEEVEEKEEDLERLKYSMGGSGAPVAEEEDTTSGVNVIGHWNNKGRAGSNSPQIVKTHARDMKVAIGFDYMRVKIGDIAVMDKFNPTLSKLLAYEEEHEADLVVDEGIVVSRKKQGSELGSPKKKAKTKRFN